MIGFIDSGVGGINILVECAKLYEENFVYLADNKNAPYGNLSKKRLYEITKHNIEYLISNYDISAIVLACNTTSVTVGEKLKQHFNIPIILTKPDISKIINLKKKVVFFGTKNTLKNNKEINNLIKNNDDFMGLYIENLPKIIDKNINKLNLILPYLKQKISYKKYKNIKVVCLCCTHYKLIKKQLKHCFIQNIEFYEYESEIAQKTLPYINESIEKSSFKIVLTEYNYPLYISLKSYMVKKLNSPF